MFWIKLFKPKAKRKPSFKTTGVTHLRLFIRESAHKEIERETFANPRNETGGGLYGKLYLGKWFLISRITGPGPKAVKHVAFFTQDPAYEIHNAELNGLQGFAYMGQWHSHHSLGLPTVSGHDISTMESTAQSTGLPLMAVVASISKTFKPKLVLTATLFLPKGEYFPVPIKIIPASRNNSGLEKKCSEPPSKDFRPAEGNARTQSIGQGKNLTECKIANPVGLKIVGNIESRRALNDSEKGWSV